jgi:hypothetical protein
MKHRGIVHLAVLLFVIVLMVAGIAYITVINPAAFPLTKPQNKTVNLLSGNCEAVQIARANISSGSSKLVGREILLFFEDGVSLEQKLALANELNLENNFQEVAETGLIDKVLVDKGSEFEWACTLVAHPLIRMAEPNQWDLKANPANPL